MDNLTKNGYAARLTIVVIFCAVLSLLLDTASLYAASPALSAASQEKLRLGERIYREGILPSGEPLRATLKGGLSVPGTSFACVSCHLRSGLGSYVDDIFTLPTNGAKLYKPFQVYSSSTNRAGLIKSPEVVQENAKSYKISQRRPEYSDQSLANTLRSGIDSGGRIMDDVMPRYLLDDENMGILIYYLKSLSTEFSPGVSQKTTGYLKRETVTTLHFATIIAEDVSITEQTAMLTILENFVRYKDLAIDSVHGIGDKSSDNSSRLTKEFSPPSKGKAILKLSLSRWVLKGSPKTWRAQLEEYNRKEPVFAILGGITNGEWQPIHQFCEDYRIPNLFPMTDFPVISKSDWYTLYFSKGYYQEGEGAANFLNDNVEVHGKPIVQIVRDSREGRALSNGFLESWRELGQQPPVTVILKAGETLTAEFLRQVLAQKKPAAIILWDGSESVKALEMLAADKNRPDMILVSSSFLGKSMFSLDEKVRDFTFITYPYGIPLSPLEISQFPREENPSPMSKEDFVDKADYNAVATNRIWQQSAILTMILHMALDDLRGNYYRDNFLDVIGTYMDQEVRLYERISFGPGQRYASKGCNIVQLTKDGLVKSYRWRAY